MEEQTSIQGVNGGGNGAQYSGGPSNPAGQAYQIPQPTPVTPSVPLANIDPETRGLLTGEQKNKSLGPRANQAGLEQNVQQTEVDLKDLSYMGKGFLGKQYLRFKYSVGVSEPLSELRKTRDDVERRISQDDRVIGALESRIEGIDKMLDGLNSKGEVKNKRAARRMMKAAEALYLEHEGILNQEKAQLEKDKYDMKQIEDKFYATNGDTPQTKEEKQKLVEAYHAFEQTVAGRTAKIEKEQDGLSKVSRKYNTFFENVRRAERTKSKTMKQKEGVLEDRSVLESVSYDLQFLLDMEDIDGAGAVATTTLILRNQAQVENYHGLIKGLEEISKRQDEIVDSIPGIMAKVDEKEDEEEQDTKDHLTQKNESQIELAKKRIRKRQGLSSL